MMHAAVLRYVREVARSGSIRRAAATLNVASSAVNRQILALEAQLGMRLFDRMPEGVRPTPAGALLLRHVGDTLHDYDRLLAELDGLRGVRSGHVRVVALDSLLVDFLPRVLAGFSRRYQAITFAVQAVAPMAVFQQLIAGEADLGLSFVVPASPAVRLVASVRMPVGAVMPAAHPLARAGPLALDAFAGHAVLLQQETLPLVPSIDETFAAFRSAARPLLVSNSIEMLRQAIRAGMGVAFFTRLGFLREIAAGELVWVRLASPRLEALRLGLFAPAQRTLSPAAGALLDEFAARLGELEDAP